VSANSSHQLAHKHLQTLQPSVLALQLECCFVGNSIFHNVALFPRNLAHFMGAHISYAAVKCLEWEKLGVWGWGWRRSGTINSPTAGAINSGPRSRRWWLTKPASCIETGDEKLCHVWPGSPAKFKITPVRRHNFHDHNSPAAWQPSGILITSFHF